MTEEDVLEDDDQDSKDKDTGLAAEGAQESTPKNHSFNKQVQIIQQITLLHEWKIDQVIFY